jgi:transcription factor SPN1
MMMKKKEEKGKRRRRNDIDIINDNDDLIAQLLQNMKQASEVSLNRSIPMFCFGNF